MDVAFLSTSARGGVPVSNSEDHRFRTIVEAATDAILSTSLDGVIESWNPGAERLFGYSAEEAVGMHVLRLVPRELRDHALRLLRQVAGGEAAEGIEARRLARDGRAVDIALNLSPMRAPDGTTTGVAAVVRDISGSKQLEDQLRELALRDPLTGLYNRRHFETELERQLSLARRTGQPGAVLMIDLDRFKEVNDTFGHEAGDELLRGVAAVLTDRLRTSDLIARVGGDEFAAILVDVDDDHGVAVARGLEERIHGLRGGSGGTIATSASIGVAGFGTGDQSREDVLRGADRSMYERKRQKLA
jgi:diguanylate cyclase (GGDEF)-like protein/PAS domain S-box-containing protein